MYYPNMIWDWYGYELHMVDGRVFFSNTIYNEMGEAFDSAMSRSIRVQGTLKKIVVTEEDDEDDY